MELKPHLARPAPSDPPPHYTTHSLKRFKPHAFMASGSDGKYIVEPGAHAGSVMECMSIGGMADMIAALRPPGLRIAMRYARDAMTNAAEVEHSSARAGLHRS